MKSITEKHPRKRTLWVLAATFLAMSILSYRMNTDTLRSIYDYVDVFTYIYDLSSLFFAIYITSNIIFTISILFKSKYYKNSYFICYQINILSSALFFIFCILDFPFDLEYKNEFRFLMNIICFYLINLLDTIYRSRPEN